MRGRPSVWSRTERLARAAGRAGDLDAVARLVAAETGTTPEAVLADAAEFGERCRAAGAFTVEEVAALLAEELGVPVREVIAATRALFAAAR